MARQPRGLRAKRRQKKQNMFVPRQAQHVLAPSYLRLDEEELRPAVVVEVSRPQGVMGATLRFTDKEFRNLPDGGMHWVAARDMHPDPAFVDSARGGVSVMSARPEPSGHTRVTVDPEPEPEASPTTTRRRRRRRRTTRSTEIAGTSSTETFSLQSEQEAATMRPAGRKGRSKQSVTQSTNRRTTSMPAARRTRKAATAEAEPQETKTTGRRRGRAAKAAEPEPEPAKNGNRRTHEDIVALVPEIVKHLQNGVTMTEIRLGGDTVGPNGYGAGPVIRKALTEAGYNTKGERIETPDLTTLEGKALVDAVVKLRQENKAWYYIELATDMSQDDLKDLLEENGHGDLAAGRVPVAEDEEEEAAEPAPKTTSRRRGRAAKAAETEPEPEPATTGRRRGRRKAANPS